MNDRSETLMRTLHDELNSGADVSAYNTAQLIVASSGRVDPELVRLAEVTLHSLHAFEPWSNSVVSETDLQNEIQLALQSGKSITAYRLSQKVIDDLGTVNPEMVKTAKHVQKVLIARGDIPKDMQ